MTVFFKIVVAVFALIYVLNPSGALAHTIKIGNAKIELDVESDFNDWQWNFKVTRDDLGGAPKGEIRSLHVEGLPGDVTDPWEYEDFGPTTFPWPDPVIDAANSGFVWSVFDNARNPLLLNGGMVTFSFDSDYVLADALATGKFRVGVDYRQRVGDVFRDVVFWSDILTDEAQFPFEFEVPEVPLPAALPLSLGGLAVFGLIGWRRRRA